MLAPLAPRPHNFTKMPSNPPKSPCKKNLSSRLPGGQAGLQPPGEASFSRGSAVIAATLPRVQQVKSAVAESERERSSGKNSVGSLVRRQIVEGRNES